MEEKVLAFVEKIKCNRAPCGWNRFPSNEKVLCVFSDRERPSYDSFSVKC